MPTIHVDGKVTTVPEGFTIDDLLPDRDRNLSIGVIRPVTISQAETKEFLFKTTAGEVVVETIPNSHAGEILSGLYTMRSGWQDLRVATFGPLSLSFIPSRKPSRYERGDLVIGCGGYDPNRSYLIFCRRTHTADHGGPAEHSVIGTVVSGLGVLDRFRENDVIMSVEPVISFAESSDAHTTTDGSLMLEEGMHIITHIAIQAEGKNTDGYEPHTAFSVDRMLLALQNPIFTVDKRLSTHIRCDRLAGTDVPSERCAARKEGTVLMRTSGKLRGSLYIYTQDLPRSLAHTVVGHVVHGIELCRIAQEGDRIAVRLDPSRFDLVGLTLAEAYAQAEAFHVSLTPDIDAPDRIVIKQKPATSLEVLADGQVMVETIPAKQVIAITLDDVNAPRTCRIFREFSGLKYHAVGRLPMLLSFEEVTLFKAKIPKTTNVIPENIPVSVVDAGVLAMTNDSCKGVGIVGVRSVPSSDFGPTSEPFSGTNIIGKVLEMEKIAHLEEGEMVYFKEVKQ